MVFIHRADQELSSPEAEGKVIKAQDFWTYRKARQAMAEGIARRDQIIGAALAAFEAEQRRGYREGHESARLEQTANMIEIVGQTVDYFSKIETQMVDLVMDAVRRIANDFDDHDKVVKVVRNSLALVRNQKNITVKVHPSQLEELRQNIGQLKQSYPSIDNIEVIAEASMAEDACIIESDIGQVEASMSGQIEALRTTFERVFGAPRDTAALQDLEVPAADVSTGTNNSAVLPNAEFSVT